VTSAGDATSRSAPSGGPRAIDQHHPLRALAVCGGADVAPPRFRGDTAAVDEAFIPAPLLLVVQLGQEGPPAREQEAGLVRRREPPPPGPGATIPPRPCTPVGTGPQDPQDALTTASILDAWASTPP
jgi:hypothetical protein